ncbi:DUF58 domain-containing protein [Tahibacter soli]|uniref:DUF58 domain-containing protein n=1 Tax=Tahibacter soli TaxID=2983605 RepID=A0A9X3YMZ1_9GAMM|nr:DUF58 domain-containing protein [Tahibacter soli]MDC8015351.1 DUF58 domain-containing protein [Tahibacter soli]
MALAAAWRARRLRLVAFAERRLPALTHLRRPEALPIRLHQRRIYVLPTLFGGVFGAMLSVMALGALNYGNNPALLLTCLLGSIAFLSVLGGYRALDGLTLRGVHAAPVFAGDALQVELHFDPGNRAREALRAQLEDATVAFATARATPTRVVVGLPTQRRGLVALPRVRLWTSWPYGLFRPWSWLNPQVRLLVYPRPETFGPPPPESARDAGPRHLRESGDEYGSLREYRETDARRMIAWKASARLDRLVVREPEQIAGRELVFDFAALEGLDHEARIARLARWVLAAEEQHRPYTLATPNERLGPDVGTAHRHRCLEALALLP